jgi:hypothetical protein
MRNYKKLVLILSLFLPVVLFGSLHLKDSTELYDYWAKRGIIEVVYAYMQDYKAVGKMSEAENKALLNFELRYIKNIENKSVSDIHNDFLTFNDFLLNNEWKGTSTKLCLPLIENFNNRKTLNTDFFSIPTNNNGNKFWNNKMDEILSQYQKKLKEFDLAKSSEIKKEEESTKIDDSNRETIDKPNKPQSGIVNIYILISIFLLGFIIGSFFLYFIIRNQVYSILAFERNKYLSDLKEEKKKFAFNVVGLFHVLKKSKDEKKHEVQQLRNELQNLQKNTKPIKEIKNEPSNSKDFAENRDDEIGDDKVSSKVYEWRIENEEKPLINEYFFTIPESDGSFKFSNAKSAKEIDCFYRIELDKNGQKGKLSFISGDFDMRALDNIDYYLNPVCDIINISERMNARKISVINSGIVLKIGDSWKIEANNKVKIKLI